MPILTLTDDDGGTSTTGGSSGGPAIIDPRTATITWAFSVVDEAKILEFEVVAYTGTDVTDLSKWIFRATVPPSTRTFVRVFYPRVAMPVVHASVRAVYA